MLLLSHPYKKTGWIAYVTYVRYGTFRYVPTSTNVWGLVGTYQPIGWRFLKIPTQRVEVFFIFLD